MSDMLSAADLMSLEMQSFIQRLEQINENVQFNMLNARKAGEQCEATVEQVRDWKKEMKKLSEDAERLHRSLDTVLFLHDALHKRDKMGENVEFLPVEEQEDAES